MKKIILIALSVILTTLSHAQKKPSEMSPATVSSFKNVLGINSKAEKDYVDTTFVKVADLVTPTSFDTLNITDKATAPTKLAGTNTTDVATTAYVQGELNLFLDNEFELIKSLGGRLQNMPVGASIKAGLASALSDGVVQLQLLYPQPYVYTIDTLLMVQNAQGNYTGEATGNRVGVYSYNLGTDTYTLVASIANNADLWKAGAGTTITCVLTAPYTTTANEILYTAVIYNHNGTQTTGPSLIGTNLSQSMVVDKTFLGTRYYINAQKTGQSDLPSSFTAAIRTNVCPFIVVK